jgi:hypothetical protein
LSASLRNIFLTKALKKVIKAWANINKRCDGIQFKNKKVEKHYFRACKSLALSET